MRTLVVLWVTLAASFGSQLCAAQKTDRVSTVGVPVWIKELVLAGSLLEVKPTELDTPVTVRIAGVYSHGEAFRYDIEYYGLEAGSFDLRDYLRRSDGSSIEDLPRLLVEIESVLAPGIVEPNRPVAGEMPAVGGYRAWMAIAALLWLAGLWAILKLGRKDSQADTSAILRPMTLAERLRPLVERAVRGELSRDEQADLELTLIAFWRKKLGLEGVSAAEAITQMKAHTEAGPLLNKLEEWLHRRRPVSASDLDVNDLLTPYRNLPADVFGDALDDGFVESEEAGSEFLPATKNPIGQTADHKVTH